MKILITGSGTLIGNTISQVLAKKNYKIYSTYNKSYPKNLKKYKNIKLFKMSLEKPNLELANIDVIIHCAAAIPDYKLNKKKMLYVNYNGFKKLIQIFPNLKHVILLSTISIYGKINKKVISEKTKINLQDNYGKSKYLMEKFLIQNSKKKYLYTILRLPGVIGKNSKHNFLSNFVINLKKNKKLFNLYNPNLLFNNTLHVLTLSKIINIILKKKINGIFLLGSTSPIKLEKIFNIAKNFKKNLNFTYKYNESGFSLNINKALSKKLPLIPTIKTVTRFFRENL